MNDRIIIVLMTAQLVRSSVGEVGTARQRNQELFNGRVRRGCGKFRNLVSNDPNFEGEVIRKLQRRRVEKWGSGSLRNHGSSQWG